MEGLRNIYFGLIVFSIQLSLLVQENVPTPSTVTLITNDVTVILTRAKTGNSTTTDRTMYGPRKVIITHNGHEIFEKVMKEGKNKKKFKLTCSTSCNPPCKILWYKDGIILPGWTKVGMRKRIVRKNSGNYTCEAHGIEGIKSSNQVKVKIHYPPRTVEIKPNNDSFYTRGNGTPITDIMCKADCLPECNFEWNRLDYPEEIFTTGRVLFAYRNFTNQYYSQFRCAASNSVEKNYSKWISITVKDGPAHVRINAIGSARENRPFDLLCSADCYHGCFSYEWFHMKHVISRGQNLKFSNLSRKDNGEYICKVKDYFGTASRKYNVNLQFGPSNVRIQYSNSDGNLTENYFGVVFITCQADCNPACRYKFYQNGLQKSNRLRRNRTRIWKTKENSGRYTCSAENSITGRVNSSNFVDILIQYKPKLSRFRMMPRYITAPGSINFTFNVDSLPPSNVKIFHSGSGEILKYDTNVKGFKSYQIEVTSCLDEGEYILSAQNGIGSDDYRNRITVKCSPLILKYSNVSNKGFKVGDAMNLTTTFIANPAANVSWSFVSYKSKNETQKVKRNLIQNGKTFTSIIVDDIDVDDFGIYQLTLVNSVGNETKTFSVRGPPQPPTELTLDCPSTAFIVWKPGFDGGINQSFLIEYTTNLSSHWLSRPLLSLTSEDNGRLSTYMSSMKLNVRYYFRVVSENEFGRVRSDKIVNCNVQAFENEEEKFLNVQTIAGISGVTFLFLVAVIVLVILGTKRCQIQNKKGLEARIKYL